MAKDLYYWDSGAFLGYLNEEVDKVTDCMSVLKQAEAGHCLIVTSALTLVEVLWLKGHTPLKEDKRDKIERFFKEDYLTVRNVTRAISELARDVVWHYNVRPKDAIHVATAVLFKVPEIHAFDTDFLVIDGVTIKNHTLKIRKPHAPLQLELKPNAEIKAAPGTA